MKFRRLVGALALAFAVALAPSAQAWVKVHNATSNTVWVAEAFLTVFNGTFCSADIPGCMTGNSQTSRVRGWWQIAPGGTSNVYGGNYHHTEQFRLYAEDNAGHTWGGDTRMHCLPWTAFDICDALCAYGCGDGTRCVSFTGDLQGGTGCCGFLCSGDDHTFNLVL